MEQTPCGHPERELFESERGLVCRACGWCEPSGDPPAMRAFILAFTDFVSDLEACMHRDPQNALLMVQGMHRTLDRTLLLAQAELATLD